jgi:hypothetical protein
MGCKMLRWTLKFISAITFGRTMFLSQCTWSHTRISRAWSKWANSYVEVNTEMLSWVIFYLWHIYELYWLICQCFWRIQCTVSILLLRHKERWQNTAGWLAGNFLYGATFVEIPAEILATVCQCMWRACAEIGTDSVRFKQGSISRLSRGNDSMDTI